MADSIPVPFDVKLMNIAATLLFALFALMLLAASAWWVLRQPFFPLAGIKVDGDVTHNNAVDAARQRRAAAGGQLLHRRPGPGARSAFESVPWVRKAVVRREFPNKLRATLNEHVPVAHWGDEAESRLINGYGEVFEANVAEVDEHDLPRLVGPGSSRPARCWACTACWRRCSQPYDLAIERADAVGARQLDARAGHRRA